MNSPRFLNLIVRVVAAAACAIGFEVAATDAEPTYLAKLAAFERDFERRLLEDLDDGLTNNPRAARDEPYRAWGLSVQSLVLNRQLVAELNRLYRAQFMGGEGPSSATALDQTELRLVITSNRVLRAAAESVARGASQPLAEALKANQTENPERDHLETWRMTAPFRRNTLPVARALFWNLLIRNQSVIDVFGGESFSRKFLKVGTVFTASRDLSTLPIERDAVVFGVMNHDVVLLEGVLLSQLSRDLGADEKLVLTLKAAYPHFRFRRNPDSRVVLADEPHSVRRLLTKINQTPGLVTVGVFPEGTRSGFAGQVPLVTKPGFSLMAVNIARKAKRPIYILPLRYNGLEYVTTETRELHLEVGDLIRVEATKDVRSEVERLRRRIEEFIGYERGRRMIDLRSPRKLPGTTGIYCASDLSKT